jgi:PAS domain S-box-containing protein
LIKIKQLGNDKTLIENALKLALDCNFASVMVTRSNAGYPIIYENPRSAELTGYSFDEAAGQGPSILQGPNTDRKLLDQLREKLDKGMTYYGKTVNYRKDGSEFIMEWKIFTLINSGNRKTHFLAVQPAI